jgi:oxygen-dependent protoporphyrinogen oxidase
MRQIAVIGAGPTGLSAAYRIAQKGQRVRVFEASTRIGGSVQSVRENGWLVEAGPNSLLENSSQISSLWRELGIDGDRIVANPAAKKRYIVRDGALCALPTSPFSVFTTSCWTGRSTRRLLGDFFRKPIARERDVSIATLIGDHFGREIVDYALNPFVSGIYAGDPHHLSAEHGFPRIWQAERTSGSIIRGLAKQGKARRQAGHPKSAMISFRAGLQQMIDALATHIPAGSIELSANVERLRRENGRWSLSWKRDGDTKRQTESFDAVILATPALALAQLPICDEDSPAAPARPLESLAQIRYSAVASLFLGFPRSAVGHPLDGFGLLVPAIEKRGILGVIFSSSLFPDRVPEGMVGLTVMVGGAIRPDLVSRGIDALLPEIMPDLRDLLGVTGEPVFQKLTRWLRAIPQYELGYERFFSDIAAVEAKHPGLHVVGNVRNGIALPACIEAGLQVADRAVSTGSAGASPARTNANS